MADFAAYLRAAREAAGLNQKDLAARAGLTGSYISLLESGRKPPPSDRVLRRLAAVLGKDESEVLETAHLARSPVDVRRRILELSRRLERERRIARSLLAHVLPSSPWLLWDFAGAGSPRLPRVGKRRKALERALRRLAPLAEQEDFPAAAAGLVADLPDEEREALVAALPELRRAPPAAPPETLTVEVTDDEMMPRLEPGDRLSVDPGAEPRPGDLVVARLLDRQVVRILSAGGRRLTLSAANPRVGPVDAGRGDLVGVVVEVRRRLR